ncbi:MAG: lipopolysaccharide heptosyltransferase II [Halioglobus sp.]
MSDHPSAAPPLSFREEPRRILLLLPCLLSETVQAPPFIEALFARFPEAEITLLLDDRQHSLLQGTPWVSRCRFRMPPDRGAGSRPHARKLLAQLRGDRFDLAILLPDSLRSAWLCWRSGARRRLGFDRHRRGLLLTDPLPAPAVAGAGLMPPADRYAVIARALGCPPPDTRVGLQVVPAAEEAVAARLQVAGVGAQRPLVLLYPGADSGSVGCWPAERFAAVADHLVRRRGAVIVISPAPEASAAGQAIQRAMGHAAVLLDSPCLEPAEMNALVARADLLLGNDSAGRQVAAAFRVPAVTVFGPTDPRRSGSGHESEAIVRVTVPCGPCHRRKCPFEEQICMTRIGVEDVARACEEVLSGETGQNT